jgi:hypothetical protein
VFDEVLARCRAEANAGRLRAIGLDATPAGRGLYERRGFLEGPALQRLRLEPEPADREPPSPGLAAMGRADLDVVLARDRGVFGADRAAVLRHALDDAPELAFVARGGKGVAGYCFGRRGDHSEHVGPVVADDPATAAALVRACAARPRRRPLTLDARAEPGFLGALAAAGFRSVRPLTRMYLDGARPMSRPELEPVVFGPEFG